jgi:hypothetical protein
MNNDMKNVKEKKTPNWHCIHEIETWNIEQGEQDYVARLYFIMMLIELKVRLYYICLHMCIWGAS